MKINIANFKIIGVISCLNLLISTLPGNVGYVNHCQEEPLVYPLLVKKFYYWNSGRPFWFTADTKSKSLRQQLLAALDSSFFYGILNKTYHYKSLKERIDNIPTDSIELIKADRLFTDAAVAVIKDIFEGYKQQAWVGYNEVSEKEDSNTDDHLIKLLLKVHSADELSFMISSLEPSDSAYYLLKQELKIQKQRNDEEKIKQLTVSINYYRWIHHFNLKKFIVVNIPSAYLLYFENDSLLLQMKTVVGMPSWHTPRFSAYVNEVILYPYWNVPHRITIKELLPRIKRKPSVVDEMNLQVIDAQGHVVDHHTLDWSGFSSKYFPYRLRQSTGCDNSLGVIKFNISSPYGVYLHDTNNKIAFLSGYRYYSHGCIRIEKPLELGNYLLNNKLDTTFLQSCLKEQKPVTINIKEPVPVFVVYMLAETDPKGKIRYYKDIYKLLK